MPRISERYAIATLIEAKDYGSAGVTSAAVNMGKLHSVTCLFTFGVLTGNSTLIPYASAARASSTTALAFNYRLAAATFTVAGITAADQFGDPIAVTSAGLTLTAATFTHKQMVVEFDSDAFLDKNPWLTFVVSATATVFLVGALAIGYHRYPGHLIPSVL